MPERRPTPAASVSPLPGPLRKLATPHRRAAERWWAGLSTLERKELRRFYGGDDGLSNRRAWRAFRELRLELGGLAADPASVDDAALHHEALYEYWGANPELTFSLEERQFHICHAHEVARGVWRRGVIPAAFRCPVRDASCPFARASVCANGRDVLLLPRIGRSGRAHPLMRSTTPT